MDYIPASAVVGEVAAAIKEERGISRYHDEGDAVRDALDSLTDRLAGVFKVADPTFNGALFRWAAGHTDEQ